MYILSLALAAAVAVVPAQRTDHQNVAAKGGIETAEVDSKNEKLTCKRLPVTGSRMWERVCLTKKQWEQVEREAKG